MRPDLLLDSSIRMSGIVLLALAATLVLRRRSAAVRHWILAAAIVCAAVAPVLERFVPAWEVPGIADGGMSLPLVQSVSPFDRLTASESAPSGAPPTRVDRFANVSYSSLVEMVWLAGVMVSILVLLVGFSRLARVASRGRRIEDGAWTRICADVARESVLSPLRSGWSCYTHRDDAADEAARRDQNEGTGDSEEVGVAGGDGKNPNPRTLVMHHDVHVHLPVSTEIDVYDAIFRSLRQNLLG